VQEPHLLWSDQGPVWRLECFIVGLTLLLKVWQASPLLGSMLLQGLYSRQPGQTDKGTFQQLLAFSRLLVLQCML
jgi:hypothetical protein